MAWNDEPPKKHELSVIDDWTSKPPSESELQDGVSPMVSAVRKGVQGSSAGFLDEASGLVEAAGRAAGVKGLGGSFDDVEKDPRGMTFSYDQLKEAYELGRNRKREYLKKDQEDNPKVSTVAELGGSILSPVNKVLPNASMAKQGAAIGAITGFGNSEADNFIDAAKDTAISATGGALIGKAFDKAAPYAGRAANYVGSKVDAAKRNLGLKTQYLAEAAAFKSLGPTLRDMRVATEKGDIENVGRYLLDDVKINAFDTTDDITKKVLAAKEKAGLKLDDIYTQAETAFKDKMSSVGFDPKRDKDRIIQAARKELGDTVGAQNAINKLSAYLDDVAARHGDKPYEQALSKFSKEKQKYINEVKQYRNELSQYRKELGQAGDSIEQGLLPAYADDFQRTGSKQVPVELNGKPASNMQAEPYEVWTQPELIPLSTKPQGQFNPARGDDLLPLKQQMELDDIYRKSIGDGYQAEILGAQNTPRTMSSAQVPSINQGSGQLKFSMAPNKPIRPQAPQDIRNPMSPRRTNDIIGSFDNEINYSRNPLSKEPATEKAFYGARRELRNLNNESIEKLGGGELVDALKKANKEYGNAAKSSGIVQDRLNREAANKWMFGLTDTIAGGAGLGYAATTGDWEGGVGIFMGKKAIEKYGISTLAKAADRVSKHLLKTPQLAQLAKQNPKVFTATVYNLVQRLEESGIKDLPKAAESKQQDQSSSLPNKGPEKWANEGADRLKKHDSSLSSEIIEKLKKDIRGRELLYQASELKPGSKAMENIKKRIRTGFLNKGDQ